MELAQMIGVRFNIVLPGGIANYADSYVVFSYCGKTQEVGIANAVALTGNSEYYGGNTNLPIYRLTCSINSVEMADKITPTFYYKDGNGEMTSVTGDDYSAQDYIDTVLGTAAYNGTTTAALVRSLANYGHYAQAYFSGGPNYGNHVDIDAYEDLPTYDAVSTATADYAIDRDPEPPVGQIAAISQSLNAETQIHIRVFATMSDGHTGTPTATYNDAASDMTYYGTTSAGLKQYMFEVPGLMPNGLDNPQYVTVSDGSATTQVTVYAYSWVYAAMNSTAQAKTKNFGAALYAYGQAAEAYVAASGH